MKKVNIPKDKLKKYWQELTKIESEFSSKVYKLEKKMAEETGIEDIEFFWCDDAVVGIGNTSRTMELIHRKWNE